MMDNNSGVVMLLSNDFVADPRVEKEARALTEAGWRVTVLAWDREGGAAEREQRHGFLIERLGPRAEHGAGPRSLPLYRRFWSAAAERARELGPRVVHCHDMDTVSAGLAAVDGTRRRLVLDFHELYRASKVVPTARGVGDVVRYAVDRVEARGLARADLVVLAWPSMRERYEGLFDGPIVVVDNAPDLDRFSPEYAPQTDPFRVCYIGQKRYVQSLRLLIDIVQKHPDMEALLAGGGVAASEVASYAEGKSGVRVVGRVRYEDIPGLYRGQSCVYTLYDQAVGNARIHMPVKVMEAMACGLPSLVSTDTWVGRYVTDKGIGIAVDPADASVVEAALLRLKDDPGLAAEMGGRGRAIVECELNWEAAAARLTDAYEPLRHH